MVVRRLTAPEGIVLSADLPHDVAAYFDADWISAEDSECVPGLLVGSGWARWGEGPAVRTSDTLAPDGIAGLVLTAVAREAAQAARSADGPIEVIGTGVIAAIVRRLTSGGQTRRRGGARPHSIVDTTGDPAEILAATQRLADLGVLVLAGEARGRPVAIDLYPEVHRRGLRLVGVAPPLRDAPGLDAPSAATDLNLDPPVAVVPDTPFPPGLWYRMAR
jgi:hypothetical protein